jgi:aminotransferase
MQTAPARQNRFRKGTFSKRVLEITLSATKQMPILAAEIGGCVSLGQGVPSFGTPAPLRDAIINALRHDPDIGKYTLQPGLPALRSAIAAYLETQKGLHYQPNGEILVTVGAMGALALAFLTLIDEGDEIILPSPTYPSYIEQAHLAGGRPVFVPLNSGNWALDIHAIEAAVTKRSKAIVVCNPSNPTGAVFDEKRLTALAKIVRRHRLFLILDETYDYLIFGSRQHFCPAALEGLKSHTILINSFSKKYALTGWRVGYVATDLAVMGQLAKVHDATAICAPTPGQYAALSALTGSQDWVDEMRAAMEARLELVNRRMTELSPWFDYVPPAGAFYLMARWKGRPIPSQALAETLIKAAKVVTIPGAAFGPGGEGHLRFSFGGSRGEINEAFDRLGAWVRRQ